MTVRTRLAGFGLVLAAALGAGWGLGALVGPVDDPSPADPHPPAETHPEADDGPGATDETGTDTDTDADTDTDHGDGHAGGAS